MSWTAPRSKIVGFSLEIWGGSRRFDPWLFKVFIGDEIRPSYVGIIINYYKDPDLSIQKTLGSDR